THPDGKGNLREGASRLPLLFRQGVSIPNPLVRLYCERPEDPAPNPKPEGDMTMPSAMQVQPYVFFDGRCDEALAFYRSALGAEVTMLMRFKESPDQGMVAPGTGDKVMHA